MITIGGLGHAPRQFLKFRPSEITSGTFHIIWTTLLVLIKYDT